MKLEMITTGEEVLSGQILDTNAAWFSDAMMQHGLELQRRSTVGDRLNDLVEIFRERSRHADVILVNGGLGPTLDDLSAEAAAATLGESLREDEQWRAHLEDWFRRRGRDMPASNLKQCLLPASATLIDNPSGSAPGFRIKLNHAWMFFTPGIPSEFKQMVLEQFIPFLRREFGLTSAVRLQKLLTFGLGESTLADNLEDLPPPDGVTLGYRPFIPYVELKLIARGKEAIERLPDFAAQVKARLGTAVVSERFSSIAEEVHHLLQEGGKTLSIAESCTGGLLAADLVEYPGSSAYLMQGVVAYSNEAKARLLNVSEATLARHGAVSPQTALEMASGAGSSGQTDYALAVTGIAGPDGGSQDKPVGTVVIALTHGERAWIQTVQLAGRSRRNVRIMSCALALDMLRRHLSGEEPIGDYPFIKRLEAGIFP